MKNDDLVDEGTSDDGLVDESAADGVDDDAAAVLVEGGRGRSVGS